MVNIIRSNLVLQEKKNNQDKEFRKILSSNR